MAKIIKRKPYRAMRYGIKNRFGEVWTAETFQAADEAERYLKK